MDERVIAQKAPYEVTVDGGEAYPWCACGRSAAQPFCDGPHKGTSLAPLKWGATNGGSVWFRGCKPAGTAPL